MKIRCDRKTLADALTWVAAALPHRPTVPVLSAIKIVAADDHVTLRAFDYEISHTERVHADVGDPGTVHVNGLLVRDLARALSGDTIDLESDDSRLHLRAGRSNYRAGLIPEQDYPDLPPVNEAKRGVDASTLHDAVAAVVAGVAARNMGLEALEGIRVEADGPYLRLITTNRYRLSVARMDCPGDDFTALVPGRALEAAVKGLTEVVQLGDGQGRLSLVTPDQSVTLSQIDAEFVKWRQLLRDRHTTTSLVDKAELLAAVKRLDRVREVKTAVTFDVQADSITLSAGGDGEDGTEIVDAATDGDPLSIGFNPEYLTSIVASIPTEKVRLGLTTSTKPGVVEPDVADPWLRHLLMPIRTNG